MTATTPDWDLERARRWLEQHQWGEALTAELTARRTPEHLRSWLLMVEAMQASPATPEDWEDVAMWPALTAGLYL
jgi:hypothetical protein